MNHRKYLHTPIALISVAYEMNSFCNSPQTIYVGVPQKSLFDVGCCIDTRACFGITHANATLVVWTQNGKSL